MRPLVSIVTPTFNRGYMIWKIILSVQKQIYPNWELLIIDDGSTDNTKQVVAEFQKDPRIKYFYQKNQGSSAARNLGLKNSKGEIITYVDSDDVIYENYLSTALEFFAKNPKKVFATSNYNRRIELYDKDFRLVDFTDSSSAQKIDIKLQDFYHWTIKPCGTGIFHKKEVLKKGIRWDTNFPMLDDLDFIMQMGRIFPNGYMHIPLVLFEYLQRYGGDGVCSNTSYLEQGLAFEKIYKKHQDDPLMKNQTWYPEKVEKYKKLQKDFEAGLVPSPIYKYFPRQAKKKS